MDQYEHLYAIDLGSGASGSAVVLEGSDHARVAAGDVREVSVRVRAPASEPAVTSRSVEFRVRALDDQRLVVTEQSRFLAPSAISH